VTQTTQLLRAEAQRCRVEPWKSGGKAKRSLVDKSVDDGCTDGEDLARGLTGDASLAVR
jgi:hypothetical protein